MFCESSPPCNAISRPRRFGKSMALQMLAAYYSRGCDSRDLRKNKEFAVCIPEEETFLGSALQEVYEQTGRQFVILIDEWDCIFRNYEENKYLQDTIWILTD